MPAIVHESPDLAQSGVALLRQSVARQPNGLVNVSVDYAVAREQEQRVLARFVVDSPPPIFPDLLSRDELQTRELYLEKFSAQRIGGVMTISAQYAGALLRGLQTPYITNNFETVNFRLFIGAIYIDFGASTNPEGFAVLPKTRLVSDIYNVRARSRIADFAACVIGDATFNVDPPKITSFNDQDGLLSAATLSVRLQFSEDASQGRVLASPNLRATPALELLDIVARAKELGGVREGELTVQSEDRIDNITPTVRVLHRKFRVVAETTSFIEPLDGRSNRIINNAIYVRFSPSSLPTP